MTAYDLIFEEIQNRYDSGVLTEEQAIEVNDLAYEKYVIEGNAYNKFMNGTKDKFKILNSEYNHLINKAKELEKLGPNGKEKAKELRDRSLKIFTDYLKSVDKSPATLMYDKKGRPALGKPNSDDIEYRQMQRNYKKDWMEKHGNAGVAPEKKYIANRYLDAQNAINKK